jgi:hypothetical protein
MSTLYERDFVQWAHQNAQLLRAGRFDEVDIENVAGEIESLGKSDQRELRSRITEIIEHLLKLSLLPDFARQPNERGWLTSIAKQRAAIRQLIDASPRASAAIRTYPAPTLSTALKQIAYFDGDALNTPNYG